MTSYPTLTPDHYQQGGCDLCTRCLGCGVRLCASLGGGVLDEVRVPATGEMTTVMWCTTCGQVPEEPIRWENVAYAASYDPWAKDSGPQPDVNTREQLLAHASQKPVRSFTQYDAGRDFDQESEDADGEGSWMTVAMDLRTNDFPVRVQILEGTDQAAAARLLRKVLYRVETEGLFDFRSPF